MFAQTTGETSRVNDDPCQNPCQAPWRIDNRLDKSCLDESSPDGDPVLAYRLACADEHFKGKWRECAYRQCRARRRCTGGPRGTYSKYARPLCEKDDAALPFALKVDPPPVDFWKGDKGIG